MYIEGPLKSGKTNWLKNKFLELIQRGISTSEILVITANSYKRKLFVEYCRDQLCSLHYSGFGSLPIFTFNGVVYNSILNNWPYIENLLPDNGESEILPNLCGLETTEYLLKQTIKEINQEENINFKDYYSDLNLLHQLLRRYRLITENYLSEIELKRRSELLNEVFYEETHLALEKLTEKSNSLKSFDYLMQTRIFLDQLKHSSPVKEEFDKVKYLLVDDLDELSNAAYEFIKALIPGTEEFHLACDPDGGARRGYLCANPDGWADLKKSKRAEVVSLQSQKPIYTDAVSLFNAIKNDTSKIYTSFQTIDTVKRADMFDSCISRVESLLKAGIKPEDLVIASPSMEDDLKLTLIEYFKKNDISYHFLSGTKKLVDDLFVFSSLIILQLINHEWLYPPSIYEVRILLNRFLGIPLNHCEEILNKYKRSKKLDSSDNSGLNPEYSQIISFIDEFKGQNVGLYDQLNEIFKRIISPLLTEESNLEDFKLILKSVLSFEKVVARAGSISKFPERDWVVQIKNTIVSDNPPTAPEIKQNSIVVATPQRIVDLEIESKYQIWLDTSNILWHKDDIGPLYNSWVFQKGWNGEEYTPELHKELTLNKAAHILRKLVLCADEKIFTFSSQLNASGNENTGILNHYLNPAAQIAHQFKEIIPREDQKPVLYYKGGKMAVPAVPGAGKTTIMLALIIELIKQGVNPSEILVLTYMESAAKLFLEKIKKRCPGLNELPYINTIHGLAFKIIQDENNFTKLGLTNDFGLCDDIERPRIIEEVYLKHLPYGEDEAEWKELCSKAISRAKLGSVTPELIENYLLNKSDQNLEEFLPVYKDFTKELRDKNLIDYDDLLVMATKLLKEFPDIRHYYQKQYKFVIEDEAQDSSKVQQELITIISDRYGNLIRCGDTNQAITTTFSSADVQGFRDFIENSHCVKMTGSQRCARDIYELANYIIDWSKESQHLKNAFLDLKMMPADGNNPVIDNSLVFNIFDTVHQEKDYILEQIKKIKEIHPEYTFGILLRTNWQVFDWAKALEDNNLKYLCRTDSLKQKKVFSFILKFLEIIENPWDKKLTFELYEEFVNAGFIRDDFESRDFLKNHLGSPFISYNPEELPTETVVNLWWDIHYWLEYSSFSAEELVIQLGSYYFDNVYDKSNAYLMSVLIKKFRSSFNDYSESAKVVSLPEIVKHFKELGRKSRVSGVRFFSESEDDDNSLAGYIQVMTVHKSKGDEFDVVFIPEMYENSYCITPDNIQIKSENMLVDKLNSLSENSAKKTEFEMKTEQMEETLRLVYVAITRAKRYLYMSSALKKMNYRGKFYDVVPSKILEHFVEIKKKPTLEVVENG